MNNNYIAYTIWNKESQIDWICRGINYFVPKGSHVHFILDHCVDSTEAQVKTYSQKYLQGYDFFYEIATEENRWQNTNVAMKRFLTKSDCDLFLSPQDDQKIQDSKLISNLRRFDPNTTGIIGMRDGISKDGLRVTHSAHHSIVEPPSSTKWLSEGEFAETDCINDGPVAMFRPTIEKVGFFDTENFHAFYTEYDYALRCQKEGLKNYVMGLDIVHEKFGNVLPSQYYDNRKLSEHDMNSLRTKHW
jgi:hypothetical protein